MTSTETSAADVRAPSVLAVLVVKDGAAWLRESLQGLAAQTHPRLGVIAVDNGSVDGSAELLEQALGTKRILSAGTDLGLAGAVKMVMDLPAAREADYLLVLHDDTALAPDAVERMLEAAEGIPGVERVGVVGPKVVDWDDAAILREVGRSTDRFGHPYSPLQAGERDHGQYDRVLEVLFVSSCAMLISRQAWQRTGPFDERLESRFDDLDFCWRARVAGFRVLMTPLAQARHAVAGAVGDRPGEHRRGPRYYAERAALASMLKDYGFLSQLWLLPLSALLALTRVVLMAASRRIDDAVELLAAWGWNVAHLPSTFRRRIRAQAVRAVPDRAVRRFMESAAVRLPRWFETAGRILDEQRSMDLEEGERPASVRMHAASLARDHPLLIAWALGSVVAALAFRSFYGPEAVTGGVMPAFPAHPGDFFRELASGVRTTHLGGAQAASPALGVLGAGSWVLFGSTGVAQKVLLLALPLSAAVLAYRAFMRATGQRPAAVVAAAGYVLSAVSLWAFSEGRVPELALLAILPALAERLDVAFGKGDPPEPRRLGAGLGVTLAVGVAFAPGILLPAAVLVLVRLVAGSARGGGLWRAATGVLVAALLVFPMAPSLGTGAGLGSRAGLPDFAALSRLSLGPAPGSWWVAWFLPAAAAIGWALTGAELRVRARCAVLGAVAGLFLAWGSAAGYLPAPLADPGAYAALAAASMSAVVAYGLASILAGRMGRQAFGHRQIGAGLLAVVLGAGLGLQAVAAALGGWAVGPDRLPPAWLVVTSATDADFRVLWIGRDRGVPFPTPGGDASGVVEAGADSLRFAITDPTGVTALDVGRGDAGPGYDRVADALRELATRTTSHEGALLAPFGVRYVMAGPGDLPPRVRALLDRQLDLDRVPAEDLVIYRNARALPPAATLPGTDPQAVRSTDLVAAARFLPQDAVPLEEAPGGWRGPPGGTPFVGDQFAPGWRMTTAGRRVPPTEAFGWAVAFGPPDGAFTIAYGMQWLRTVEMLVLGVLWAVALWATRKPVTA